MRTWTAQALAERLDGVLEGAPDGLVLGIAGLREAGEGDLSFLANRKYARWLKETRASVVLVPAEFSDPAPCALIRVTDPDAAFAKAALLFAPPSPVFEPGVHPSAVIAGDVVIGEGAYIGPGCVLEPGAVIGARSRLIAQVYVGHGACLGEENLIYPHVTIREGSRMGNRVIIHSSAVVGSDGFGYSVDAKGVRTKIPQLGIVVVGDDVEIGAATTIDRARFGRTVIGNGVKIDNLVQIAHNVVIGDHAVIVSQVGISGSTVIGRHSILAGQVGVVGHVVVGDRVVATGRSVITKDIPSGQIVQGFPAVPRDEAARTHAHVQRLPKLKEQVRELEQRVLELEQRAL